MKDNKEVDDILTKEEQKQIEDIKEKSERIKKVDTSEEAKSVAKKYDDALNNDNNNEIKYERLLQTFGHVEDDPTHGPACGHCVQQKKVLEEIKNNNEKIKIEEFNIYKDPEGKKALQSKKVQVIPTTFDCPIDDNGNIKKDECVEIQGFNENYFKKYLEKSE